MRRVVLALLLSLICTAACAQNFFIPGWNGRLVQTSLGFPGCQCDWAFSNYDLDSSEWTDSTGHTATVDFSSVNQQGYPTNNTNLTATNGWAFGSPVPSSANRAAPSGYIRDWVGYASIKVTNVTISSVGTNCVGGASVCVPCVNVSGTVTGTSCIINLSAVASTFPVTTVLSVGTGASGSPCSVGVACPQLTQLRFYNTLDQAAVNQCSAGILFSCFDTTQYVPTVQNFGAVRALNKSNLVTGNVAWWSDRTPYAYRTYAASYWPSWSCGSGYNLASCIVTANVPTVSSGAQYTLAFTGFTLSDKYHVVANFPAITPPSAAVSQSASSGTAVLTFSGGVPASVVQGMTVGDANRQNVIQPTATVASTTPTTVTLQCASPCTSPIFGTVQSGDTIVFSPMLNVNGTGYVPIVTPSNLPIGASGGTFSSIAAQWSALTYDASLNVYLMNNASDTKGARGLIGGWPPEIWAAFANKTLTHIWNPTPCYAFDLVGDFVSQSASYFKGALNKGGQGGPLIEIREGVNELWNYAQTCTAYADAKQFLLNAVNFDHANFYGTNISKIGQLYSTLYGADRTKYRVADCMQEAAFPTRGGGGEDEKLQSPWYVSQTSSANAAYKWVTNVCYASYTQSSFNNTVSEIGWAYAYSVSPSSALVGNFLAGLNTTSGTGTCNAGSDLENYYWMVHTAWPCWNTYIAGYNSTYSLSLKESMYEGGYAQNGGGSSSFNTQTQQATIASFTPGSPTVLTIGSNAYNYICNTAGLCTGSAPTGTISGTGCAALDGHDPAIQSATATTITVNLNSTGCTTSGTGQIVYDGAGTSSGYMEAFEIAVMQDMTNTNLSAWELLYFQGFYTAAQNASVTMEFPAEYDTLEINTFGKVYPNIYSYPTKTPVFNAMSAYQAAP